MRRISGFKGYVMHGLKVLERVFQFLREGITVGLYRLALEASDAQ